MHVRSAIAIIAFAVMLMFSDALDWRNRMVNPNSALAAPFVVFGMLGVVKGLRDDAHAADVLDLNP